MSRDETSPAPPAATGEAVAETARAAESRPPWAVDDPLETLLEMARRGEIDPWNVDIIKVTDGFLAHLEQVNRLNLRLSGRALLYAAILLRMKSDALVEEEQVEQRREPPPWDASARLPLEPRVLHPARRPATLYELIEELRRAEKVKEHKALRRAERTRRELQRPTVEDAMGVAHEMHLREDAEALWARLQQLLDGRECVGLSELVTGGGVVEAYLPLLFLAQWRRVNLEQEVLFEELLVYPRKDGGDGAPQERDDALAEAPVEAGDGGTR